MPLAEADPEIDSASRHPVQTGQLIGEQNGLSQRRQVNCRAQSHSLGAGADGGERRQRVDARPRSEAVAYPERMKAKSFGALREAVE